MNRAVLSGVLGGFLLIAGCAEEPPPPSVQEFLDNKVRLDAAMVRCAENRAQNKYLPECVNAREASNRIARAEELERQRRFEAESERKRAALRRAQQAAAEARRRVEEAEARRREAEYLSLFEPAPEASTDVTQLPQPASDSAASAAEPGVPAGSGVANQDDAVVPQTEDSQPATVDTATAADAGGDLEAIREELKRRNEGS